MKDNSRSAHRPLTFVRLGWLPAAALLLVFSNTVLAAVATWDGTVDASWNSTSGADSNWTGGLGTNGRLLNGDSAVFTSATGVGGVNLNNDLTSGAFNVAGITFNAGAAAFVIGDGTTNPNVGNTFVLTGNVLNSGTNLETINNPFSMTAVRSFTTTTGGGNIALGGNISGTGGGINKLGVGTLTLTGTNTYTGTTTVTAGTLTIASGSLAAGASVNAQGGGTLSVSGSLTLSGASTQLVTQNVAGTGTIDINTGGIVNNGGGAGLIIGQNTASHDGILNVSGTYTQSANSALFGNTSVAGTTTGTLNINSGGLVTFSSTMTNSSASGTSNASGVVLGRGTAATTGTFNLNTGGTLETAKNIIRSNGTGNFNFNGGTLKALANSSNTGLDVTTTTINSGGAIVNTNGFDFLITDPLIAGTGTGGLTKNGGGILTISGASTYAGDTNINVGTLKLASGATIAATPLIDIDASAVFDAVLPTFSLVSGQKLQGNGTVNGGVTMASGSLLAPGQSVGTLSFTLAGENLDLTSIGANALQFELATMAASDKVVITGGTLDVGTLNFSEFSFTTLGGFGPGVYTLFDAASTINGVIGAGAGVVGGYAATLSIDNSTGVNEVLLTVVPEPSSLAMLLFGSVVLWVVGRKRIV